MSIHVKSHESDFILKGKKVNSLFDDTIVDLIVKIMIS